MADELRERDPDVEKGLRLVALLVAKLDELEQRVELLERERVRRQAA